MHHRIPNRKMAGLRPARGVVSMVAGFALLAGYSGHLLAQSGERFVQAPEVAAGDALSGELTSASPVNFNNGARHSPHWVCPAEDVGGVTTYVLDAPFAGVLSAFDTEGRFLGSAEGEEGTPLSLLVGADQEECSLVVVNGSGSRAFGPYRLVAHSSEVSEPLSLGAPLAGLLDDDGKASHSLSLEQAARVDLTLSSSPGLALVLRGEGREERADTCVEGEQRLQVFLESGDYRLDLTDTAGRMASASDVCGSGTLTLGGAYQLVVSAQDLSTGMRSEGPLRGGDSITGMLESGASNRYGLEIKEVTSVSIALSSGQFDTLLSIDGEGVSLSDDDSGGGTDSLLETVLVPGSYRVEVTGYGAEGGEYNLDVRHAAFDGEFVNEGGLALGDSLRGMLAGSGNNSYSLTLAETTDVRVALDSSNFDAVVRLHGNGIDVSDDDSGGDLNALLSTVLEPGTYTLEVQSYSGRGVYDLAVMGEVFEGVLRNDGEVRVGEVVIGSMQQGSPLLYELVVDEAAAVVLEATSPTVDTVLSLSGNGVDVDNDDADGLGYGSRITQQLEPGRYAVSVSAWGSGGGTVRLEARH